MRAWLLTVLMLVSFPAAAIVDVDLGDTGFRLNGFITLGGAWVDGDRKLVGSGSGLKDHLDEFSIKWPTTVGLHATYRYKDFSIVTQAVTMGRQDWDLDIEIGYLAYQPTENLTFRVGRMTDPYLMLSQIRHVGLAYPWPLPLFDLYGLGGQVKGFDIVYRRPVGDWDLVVNPYYLKDVNPNQQLYGKQLGFQASLLKDDKIEFWLTLHRNHLSRRVLKQQTEEILIPYYTYVANYYMDLGYPITPEMIDNAMESLRNNDMINRDSDFHRWAVGWRYEDDKHYFMGHLSKHLPQDYGTDLLVWYLVYGYNITPKIMPYAEYGFSKATGAMHYMKADYSDILMDYVITDINKMFDTNKELTKLDLEVSALGVRYAVEPGLDIKFEWRRFTPKNGTRNYIVEPFDTKYTDMFTFVANYVF
ncbi:MAG: hypothetical protein D6B27_12980 [Gammaproteobacteria bacterium]|nr:MAG: hypothetical protein D6B27_12980 [Gammaproteobacteria bacterium]